MPAVAHKRGSNFVPNYCASRFFAFGFCRSSVSPCQQLQGIDRQNAGPGPKRLETCSDREYVEAEGRRSLAPMILFF